MIRPTPRRGTPCGLPSRGYGDASSEPHNSPSQAAAERTGKDNQKQARSVDICTSSCYWIAVAGNDLPGRGRGEENSKVSKGSRGEGEEVAWVKLKHEACS